MTKNLLAAALVAVAFLTSCTTVRQTAQTASVDYRVEQLPVVADLTVLPPATAETEWEQTPVLRLLMPVGQRLANLEAELLAKQGADVLLEPQHSSELRRWGYCSLRLTGYPARLSNFRTATPADLEALRADVPDHRRRVYRLSSRGCCAPKPACGEKKF